MNKGLIELNVERGQFWGIINFTFDNFYSVNYRKIS